MTELTTDGLVIYGTSIFCPFETGVTAEIISLDDDEDLGYEVATYQCSNGHTWQRPSYGFILRSIGYGDRWRAERDRLTS